MTVRDHEKKTTTNIIMTVLVVEKGKVFGDRSAKKVTPRKQINI